MVRLTMFLLVIAVCFANCLADQAKVSAPPEPGTPKPANATTPKPSPPPPSTTTQIIPFTSTTSPSKPTPTTPLPHPTSTLSPSPATNATTTAVPTTARPPQPSDRKFDAFSFIGGFALAVGLVAIGFLVWKLYLSRRETVYHTL